MLRVGGFSTPYPPSRLEDHYLPDLDRVLDAVDRRSRSEEGVTLKEFKLPDVGEGLTEAEIVKWHVTAGRPVEVNQTIVEIETAKAVVELPCPFEGVVAALMAAEGETVDVGRPIIAVDDGADAGPAAWPRLRRRVRRRARDGRWPATWCRRCPRDARGSRSASRCWWGTASSWARPPAVARKPSPTALRRRSRPSARRRPPSRSPPSAAPPAVLGLDAAGLPGRGRRSVAPGRARCWPSRRCASWPGTSAST